MVVSERQWVGEAMAVGEGVREEKERCDGARNKYLYLCAAVILPTALAFIRWRQAARQPPSSAQQGHTIMIRDHLTQRIWCADCPVVD
jgi:hypothetical protein